MPVVIKNLKYLRNSYSIDLDLEISSFLYEWDTYSGEILKNLKSFDRKYNYEHGTGITIFRHLLARKILTTDINIPIDLHGDVKTISYDSEQIVEEGLA
ncbi:TnsA endonuclease C-terminal domain-containing protein [Paenibacillus septentrionalis]|uniref:TnsA endonuclease C-terminal domain-containing protein n=1 Tax=Paenibacillus septentrionalis TaxID=429342 RepID=A0ABW1VCB9_9BACL